VIEERTEKQVSLPVPVAGAAANADDANAADTTILAKNRTRGMKARIVYFAVGADQRKDKLPA
jgi:hypothetical protein